MSMIEVAMAMLFLALALVPLVDSVLSRSRRAREDKMRVFAMQLAASAMERYRLEQAGTGAVAVGGAGTDPVLSPPDAPPGWAALRQKFDLEVTAEPDGPGEALEVRVSWDEAGHRRQVEMVGVLSPTFGGGS